jgi:lactoylglutathione lyase
MRFGFTILYVGDVAASVDFYERAFGLERRLLHDSGEYAELETGATALAFASRTLAAQNVPGLTPSADTDPRFEVCLVTEDVRGGYARAVGAGAAPVSEPATKPWGQDVAYVRDPDGVLIEIASPA